MTRTVLIAGDGLFADVVSQELAMRCQVIRQSDVMGSLPAPIDIALVVHDAWHPSVHHQAETVYRLAGVPWLRGYVSFGEGVIGPLVLPSSSGCSQCADMRRLMAGQDRKQMWDLGQALGAYGGAVRDAWASNSGVRQMAQILVSETLSVLEGRRALTEGKVFFMNLKSFDSSLHAFLPNPMCPVCGQQQDDSAALAKIQLEPTPKISPNHYRSRSIAELKEFLARDYLDYRMGFLNGKVDDLVSPFASVSVNLPLLGADEATAGRTFTYEDSELTAILEGLERYCGITPRGKKTVVRERFHDLKTLALNPMTVGVHAKEQYAQPNFPFQPFDPDRELDWVWGYSLLQDRAILVPELLAYYSLGCGDGFVYETSNGCALGGSLVEAILYGIFEIVERDAFLMTWYAQLPLPRLDPYSAGNRELTLMMDRLQTVTGYDLHLFNATMENGIPSVWALAKNREDRGRTRVNLTCAAGAHVDPVRAVKSAIHELAGMLLTLDDKYEAERERCLRMYRDPFEVRHMEDHSLLYSLPEAGERFQFLLDASRPILSFHDAFQLRATHEDLADDLRDLLETFRRLGLDVIVVNQTTPELSQNGLHCVKVIIPGMLPMTFGYHLTRLEGLDRVLNVPMQLGYVQQPLKQTELNPHPHPFP